MARDLVGGQALIDGVMMRRGSTWAAAARRADGSIASFRAEATPALARWRGVPVLRGTGALVDSVRIGMRAMRWSREQGTPNGSSHGGPVTSIRERAVVVTVVGTVVAAFLFVPLGIATGFGRLLGGPVGIAVVEGLARLGLFVAYLAMLSRLPGVRETLEYHGAEHMVVAAYEAGGPVDVPAARNHSTRHPRCGTDFFGLIFAVSIVVFSVVGSLPAPAMVLSRVLLAPVVVGISYEVMRAAGTSAHTVSGRLFAAPGLWLQRFTTAEPTDAQVDVAIAALDALLAPAARESTGALVQTTP
ncbi:MAG: DUF1385 domain-containing protein [Microthrixaceae bacterium]